LLLKFNFPFLLILVTHEIFPKLNQFNPLISSLINKNAYFPVVFLSQKLRYTIHKERLSVGCSNRLVQPLRSINTLSKGVHVWIGILVFIWTKRRLFLVLSLLQLRRHFCCKRAACLRRIVRSVILDSCWVLG